MSSVSRDIIVSKLLDLNIYYIDSHEQATYAKHKNTVPRDYLNNSVPTGRKTSPITEKDDNYDYNNDYKKD